MMMILKDYGHSMGKEFGAGTHFAFEHSDGATRDLVERMSFCVEQ